VPFQQSRSSRQESVFSFISFTKAVQVLSLTLAIPSPRRPWSQSQALLCGICGEKN
jgi:hypothetical protein